ncbi:DUF2071 domain-containing protein [Streptomyces sp. NPDC031705]|uniref:YqjF family protein n=1 Tax=Streptomyces sp. NPDC031705 TaxID=3155729 RepID=UPI0033F1705E
MADVRVPLMSVHWRRQAFVHWPYPPAVLERFLPPRLEVDVFEGQGWVSLTPFVMSSTRVLGVPLPPPTFPETNLRTYVRCEGGPSGLWFFSLDVAHPALPAGRVLGIPYSLGRLTVQPDGRVCLYAGRRGRRGPGYELEVRTVERVEAPHGLDSWLTNRFHVYTTSFGMLWRIPASHEPWPLFRGTLEHSEQSLLAAAGLPEPLVSPLVHTSPGVGPVHLGFPRPG